MKPLNQLSNEQLQKLPTPHLLALYKSERRKFKKFQSWLICECCGQYGWDIHQCDDYSKEKKELSEREEYVSIIKDILSTRETVKK